MSRELITIQNKQSGLPEFTSLIISVRAIRPGDSDVVVGFPGLPNVTKNLENGDAVLFETPLEGTLEARMIAIDYPKSVQFLVSRVSARAGLLGGIAYEDPNNSPFSDAELERIAASIEAAKVQIKLRLDIRPEQLELIERKLDEIGFASERMGRKDWVNYVAGSLTSVCISAAFAPDLTRAVFVAVNTAFGWLFTSALVLIS